MSKEKDPDSLQVNESPRAGSVSPELDAKANEFNDGATRVDLGEDLLEKTAVLILPSGPPQESPRPLAADKIEDQFQSARILVGEGIVEEAKRILRQILLSDPDHSASRKMLEQIHETELKQIFGETETPRRRAPGRDASPQDEVKAEVIMRLLDRDLNLGMFSEEGGESRALQLSLFENREAMSAFSERMDRDYAGAPVADRLDIGIAFLEMGLYDLAIRHFESAVQTLTYEPDQRSDLLLSATSLLGYALILGSRPFEATIALQTVLRDSELEAARKLDLIYLMGRAYDAMKKATTALQWYKQAAEIDPDYRDLQERLRALTSERRGGGQPQRHS